MKFALWFRSIAKLWVVVSALLLALALLGIVFFALWYSRPSTQASAPATAVLNVILAPTATMLPPTPTATPQATPSLPAPPPGVIAAGGYVQITGTGGDGLRLRETAGLEQRIRVLGAENEIFLVIDGPEERDGYVWWYLEGPYDSTRSGWAVANFLQAVQGP